MYIYVYIYIYIYIYVLTNPRTSSSTFRLSLKSRQTSPVEVLVLLSSSQPPARHETNHHDILEDIPSGYLT